MTNKLMAVAAGVGVTAVVMFATGTIGTVGGHAGARNAAFAADAPIVVELFTSQSCYSCPPAEAFLGELLATRDDILALEFHVDYWDTLNYGSAGRWKDVFSSPESTHRQSVYNQAIRGRSGGYTPQMVIHGEREAVGSRRGEVNAALAGIDRPADQQMSVAIAPADGHRLTVTLDGPATPPAAVWLIRFDREHSTRVLRGENKGKTLTNHNVVRDVQRIGDWQGQALTIELDGIELGDNQGCAVLVQPDTQGPILGAAACPTASS